MEDKLLKICKYGLWGLMGLIVVILAICVFKGENKLKTRDWVTVKGTLKIEPHKLYRNKGPVLYVESTEFAVPPKQEVATFY